MTSNEVKMGQIRGFVHPLLPKEYFDFDSSLPDYQRLHLLCPEKAIGSEYQSGLFSRVFPSDLPSKPYNPESIQTTLETEIDENEHIIRRALLRWYGYASPDEEVASLDPTESVTRLHVGFNRTTVKSLTYLLNRLPEVENLKGISMTDPLRLPLGEITTEDPRFNINRDEHTKHIGYYITLTNLRFALNHPILYMRRVEEDLRIYSRQFGNRLDMRINEGTISAVDQAIRESKLEVTEALRGSLYTAAEYGKYLLTAAYLHDIETTGWGDIFMKSDGFSEDERLRDKIIDMVSDSTGQLGRLISLHGMNEDLLVTMVSSMSSESDVCLGGYLMKDKRRFAALQIQQLEPPYAFLPKGEGYDHDQMSGTETNIEWLSSRLLPGGFKRKTGPGSTVEDPIGSFEDRARILAFMLATGMTKDDMREACIRIEIDPNRIFITAEEVSLGYNLALEWVELENEGRYLKEIMVVATRPGDVKKAMLIFNIARIWHYQSAARTTIESFVKTLIRAGQAGIQDFEPPVISESTFIHRTDDLVRRELNDKIPVIPWVLKNLASQAYILTEGELTSRIATDPELLTNCLIQQTDMSRLIQMKKGTLVMAEDGEGNRRAYPWTEILSFKEEERKAYLIGKIGDLGVHPESLPSRLHDAEEFIGQQPLYMLIELTAEQKQEIDRLIDKGGKSSLTMREAFKSWQLPVDLSDAESKNI